VGRAQRNSSSYGRALGAHQKINHIAKAIAGFDFAKKTTQADHNPPN